MAASGVNIAGLDALLRTLNDLDETLREDVDFVCKAAAYDINADASRFIQGAAFDNGELLARQQVVEGSKPRTYEVVNTAPYAAYVHFGTGPQVRIPQGWQDVANEWRNVKGGTFDEFMERMKEWLPRHGISADMAYVVCISILTNGLEARPFLSTPFEKHSPRLIQDIKDLINDALTP